MSWDVFFIKVPEEIKSVSEIPNDYNPPPLGTLSDILDMLKELLPDVDFSDPHWGVMATGTYSIEFNIGNKDPVESIMLHIRGENAPIDIIKKICKKTLWMAIDTSSGDFIDFENCPEESFNEWKRYRDKIIDEFKQK